MSLDNFCLHDIHQYNETCFLHTEPLLNSVSVADTYGVTFEKTVKSGEMHH